MPVHLLPGGRLALPRPPGSVWRQTSAVWEDTVAMRNTFPPFFYSHNQTVSIWGKIAHFIHRLLAFLACVMLHSNGPPDHSGKCCRAKRTVAELEGLWQGKWGMEMERRCFGKWCSDELWHRREKGDTQSLCSLGFNTQKFIFCFVLFKAALIIQWLPILVSSTTP